MRLLGLLLLVFLCSCSGGDQVTRRRGDVSEIGRRISPLAYAWYARGVYHEGQGEMERAAYAYSAAINHDEKSGASWAALGRVLCKIELPSATEVFSKGLRKAERTAPIYLERSRCQLERAVNSSQGDKKPRSKGLHNLCVDAERALDLEPENPAVTRHLVDCFVHTGNLEKATRYERAASLYFGEPFITETEPGIFEVDLALRQGDLRLARSLALDLVRPGELAARAALWGKNELARDQAELVLAASPHDADALVTLVYLGDFPAELGVPQELSAAGVLLFAAVLRRSVSESAARTFISEYASVLAESTDPLVVSSRGRSKESSRNAF
jgi:tetratricopeptide (TPR) repeat protein